MRKEVKEYCEMMAGALGLWTEEYYNDQEFEGNED